MHVVAAAIRFFPLDHAMRVPVAYGLAFPTYSLFVSVEPLERTLQSFFSSRSIQCAVLFSLAGLGFLPTNYGSLATLAGIRFDLCRSGSASLAGGVKLRCSRIF
ncbi:hypothetical protein GUJ93_ZPchr0008g12595 [Zizania palustris]|uniref:Uncharacterized protein n=1 Tax=Zizania palustris TaxID=103762 RepID=A0A8J5R360_ZIZPA|nr:hypothetical protein GUJ93_ZPchr0008g12595 [Zizania palustris]